MDFFIREAIQFLSRILLFFTEENNVCIFGFKGASTSKVIGARNGMMDDYDGQMIFGDLVGLKLPDIRLTGEEKPRKTSPRKPVPTGDRTRARCYHLLHSGGREVTMLSLRTCIII